MKKLWLFFMVLFLGMVACDDHCDIDQDCGNHLIISSSQYEASDMSGIFPSMIENDSYCLTLNVGFSGCDDDHDFSLIHDGEIMESFPPQITVALRDNNPQDCDAIFDKDFMFDLSPKSDDSVFAMYDEVIIHFKDTDVQYVWKKEN